jgi:hypothetical protein
MFGNKKEEEVFDIDLDVLYPIDHIENLIVLPEINNKVLETR